VFWEDASTAAMKVLLLQELKGLFFKILMFILKKTVAKLNGSVFLGKHLWKKVKSEKVMCKC
jgi:hypothetical protein